MHLSADSELIAALRGGDDRAYELIVREHTPRMLATARRLLNDEAEAQDSVQEAFLNAFRGIDRFEEKAALGTWLHRIVINAALQRLRTRRRRAEESIEPLLPEFDDNDCRLEPRWGFPQSVEQIVQQRALCDLVISSIHKLPELHRTVLLLRDIEELDTNEVAAILDISAGTVKTRLHRARAALKKLLHPLWGEL